MPAITRVQSAAVAVNGTTGTFTVSLAGVAAGDALCLSMAITDTQAPTVIGDGVNTWHYATAASTLPPWIDCTGTGLNMVVMQAYALNVAAGSVTVTVTLPASAAVIANGALEQLHNAASAAAGCTLNPGTTLNPAQLPGLAVPAGGYVAACIAGEFAQTGLVPIAPLTADPADANLFAAFAQIATAQTYPPSWTNTSPRTWGGAALAFAPAASPAVVSVPRNSVLDEGPPAWMRLFR